MSCSSSRRPKSIRFRRRFCRAASITISGGLRAGDYHRLRHVATQDGMTIEDRSFTALARASEGSMRDGLSLLDQAVAFGGKTIAHADLEVLLGAVPQELVQGMSAAILAQDSPAALAVLANLLDQGHDLKAFCSDVVELLRNLLVASVVPAGPELRGLIEATEEDIHQLAVEAKKLTPEQLQELLTIFSQAEDSLRYSAHPRFVLETAAVRATRLVRQQEKRTETRIPDGNVAVGAKTERPHCARHTTSGETYIRHDCRHASPSASGWDSATALANRHLICHCAPGNAGCIEADCDNSTGAGLNASGLQAGQGLVSSAPHRVGRKRRGRSMHPLPARSSELSTLNWELVQEEVAASFPNFAPFLEAGRFVSLEGGQVTIGFAKQATLARSMMEKEDNLRALAALCERQVGQPVRIRVIELSASDPPGLTMAQVRAAKEQEQRMVLFERARATPVAKQALDIFGADLAAVRTVAQKETGE